LTLAESDSAEANDSFTTAAGKYQLLVDSGIRNAGLYINLGNAYLQGNQLGLAIANYEKARLLDPAHRQLAANLELANSLVKGAADDSNNTGAAVAPSSVQSIMIGVRKVNEVVTSFVGLQSMVWVLAVASTVFWGIFIARAAGCNMIARRWAIPPLLLLLFSMTSILIETCSENNHANGVIVANHVTLYAGDGEQFDAISSLDEAQGNRVHILASRGNWTQVKTGKGHVGWLKGQQVYPIN
jgi:tetratricopeptide (TPR) repeat protein